MHPVSIECPDCGSRITRQYRKPARCTCGASFTWSENSAGYVTVRTAEGIGAPWAPARPAPLETAHGWGL